MFPTWLMGKGESGGRGELFLFVAVIYQELFLNASDNVCLKEPRLLNNVRVRVYISLTEPYCRKKQQ